MTTALPTTVFNLDSLANLQLSMNATGEGEITFFSSNTTFEVSDINMTTTMEGSTTTGTASFNWSYTGPSGNTYHGSISMQIGADGGMPATLSGNVLDENNNIIGTITVDNASGSVRIRLNDGTEIYAGI
jgi:hypothetical protein